MEGNMESKVFSEKLEKILIAYEKLIPVSDDISYHRDKAHKAILELVKSIVPDERVYEFKVAKDNDRLFNEIGGFNYCRQEILNQLS